ncbi:MAG TPA: serine hydrolase [Blastocatellia bacterium]|nr:serine hydrolase [Blastocatellia bacterium]
MHRRTLTHKLCLLMLAIGVAAAPLRAAGAQDAKFIGHWEGAIQVPGTPLAMSVDFAAKAGGGLSATISIPAQNAKDIPLSDVSQTNTDIAFKISGVPGDPSFKGTLSADGAKINGTFTQGGANIPFVLERKASPTATTQEALKGFDEVVADAMKKLDVPGMAIAIVKYNEVVYAKGFGYRDVEKQLPVTADTLFAIGSSTKAFTTFVLGTLVDEGKLEWDKPVRSYIPSFKLYDPIATERLSVRDLVTHRSGLPRHDLVWYNNYDASRKSLVERLPYLEPSADLREKFQYNNLMFLTAGYLTEVVTGKTWEEAVRERILLPLGMTRTNFSVNDSQKEADAALPYRLNDKKVERMPFRPITNLGPAGSINSSVNEMSRWVIAHLNGGKYGDKRIANAATVEDMHLAHMTTGATIGRPDVSPADYGMGWFVNTYRGHRRVEHGGNIDGFSANVTLFPQDGLGVVVLTNMNGTPLRDLIVNVLADRLLKIEPVDWIAQAAAVRAASDALQKEGEKKKQVTRVQGTQPAHKLDAYVGEYEHPGYGSLKVTMQDGKLEATFNGIRTPLEHWHYETFSGLKAADPTFENMKYTFQTDADGYVARVAVPFEAAVKEIVFTKRPDARLYEAEYLKRFSGTYRLPGAPVTISLKGNALSMMIPGQPAYDLVPSLSGDFTLKQAQIVSMHFVADETGKVTAAEIRQPGAVITAKRQD